MKNFFSAKALPISLIIGIGTIWFWLTLVGNPHVIETILGVAFGSISGGYTYFRLRKLATANK